MEQKLRERESEIKMKQGKNTENNPERKDRQSYSQFQSRQGRPKCHVHLKEIFKVTHSPRKIPDSLDM